MTRLVHTRAELAGALAAARSGGERVALVPTMGALHSGHASLVQQARAAIGTGQVVVSVFVNPMQFAPGEDLDRYPRTLTEDVALCAEYGADVVFAPQAEEVYPGGVSAGASAEGVTLHPGPLGDILEGASRPGHFAGVLTVVAKLFGLVRPDLAIFGQKDYQQLALIRQLVTDLCLGIEIVGAETIREPDGLALSSRNRYLSPTQRQTAGALSAGLRAAQQRASYGVPAARWAAMSILNVTPGLELDYLALTSVALGEPPERGEGRILVAAKVGSTRLIDNMPIIFGLPVANRAVARSASLPQ